LCGLIVEAAGEDDLGQWSCVLNDEEEGERPFHRGTFQVLNEGYLQDVSTNYPN